MSKKVGPPLIRGHAARPQGACLQGCEGPSVRRRNQIDGGGKIGRGGRPASPRLRGASSASEDPTTVVLSCLQRCQVRGSPASIPPSILSKTTRGDGGGALRGRRYLPEVRGYYPASVKRQAKVRPPPARPNRPSPGPPPGGQEPGSFPGIPKRLGGTDRRLRTSSVTETPRWGQGGASLRRGGGHWAAG